MTLWDAYRTARRQHSPLRVRLLPDQDWTNIAPSVPSRDAGPGNPPEPSSPMLSVRPRRKYWPTNENPGVFGCVVVDIEEGGATVYVSTHDAKTTEVAP